MKNNFLIILVLSTLSCNNKIEDKTQNENGNQTLEKIIEINQSKVTDSETLITGINLDNSLFDKSDIDLKKYKFKGVFIENIKIKDLLNKEYRDDFFKYLVINNGDDGTGDEFKPTLFIQLLFTRIQQLEDKNAYFLLKECSKITQISYSGIELFNESLWELFLEKPTFFVTEASHYNDIEILDFLLVDMAREFLKTDSELRDYARMCYCDDLKSGLILLEKNKLETIELKKFKEKFKNEAIIEIDCSPTFETRQNTTEEYYDIKSVIDKEMESKLGVKEKLFYKLRIVPILKDYVTK